VNLAIWIGSLKDLRRAPSLISPFAFEPNQAPSFFLQVVNLLPLVGSPEIQVGVFSLVVDGFNPFTDKEILPKCANILAQFQRVEVVDQGIPYPKVIEIYLALLTQLLA
jgi:hypothetical protein